VTVGPENVFRQVDEATAEREVVEYLRVHGTVDTAELSEKLRISIISIIDAVQHLKRAGRVERVH